MEKKAPKEPKVVFTAMSRHYFCYRMFITKFVLEREKIPISVFTLYDYFLLDTVSREFLIICNNALIRRVDELWVFGPLSDGVRAEIKIAKKAGKPIKYFRVSAPNSISEIKKAKGRIRDRKSQD
ncbi:hypothetical protein L0Y49_00460 [bacterium]|nr:hypothetical protein [bacterium]MCI0679961.1 hypothetical protein [bacterium]